jgi:hypothetical protein
LISHNDLLDVKCSDVKYYFKKQGLNLKIQQQSKRRGFKAGNEKGPLPRWEEAL